MEMEEDREVEEGVSCRERKRKRRWRWKRIRKRGLKVVRGRERGGGGGYYKSLEEEEEQVEEGIRSYERKRRCKRIGRRKGGS